MSKINTHLLDNAIELMEHVFQTYERQHIEGLQQLADTQTVTIHQNSQQNQRAHQKAFVATQLRKILRGSNDELAGIKPSEALINAMHTYILKRYLTELKMVTENTLAFQAVQAFMSQSADEQSISAIATNTDVLTEICQYALDMSDAYNRLCETDAKYQCHATTCFNVASLLVIIGIGLAFAILCLVSHALPLAVTALAFYSGAALLYTLEWYFKNALHSTAENRSLQTLKNSSNQTDFADDFFKAEEAILQDTHVSNAEKIPRAYFPRDVFSKKNTPIMFKTFLAECADNVNLNQPNLILL